MEVVVEVEEKFDEFKFDVEEKDRMCIDIYKVED